jgi:acid phosphatase
MRFCKTTLWIKKSSRHFNDMSVTSFGRIRPAEPVSATGFRAQWAANGRFVQAALAVVLATAGPAAAADWSPSHIVVVIEENHAFEQIIGNPDAPFINKLAAEAALFIDAHGITHPSQPNYLALFSGSTQNTAGDRAVRGTPLGTPNLGAALIAKGYGFAGYSEGLPEVGSLKSTARGGYARKHNPWSNWQAAEPGANQLAAGANQPFKNFPSDFTRLPTVAFVVPNLYDDQHGDGFTADRTLIRNSDDWLKDNIGAYAQWAVTHDSLLIVTWDEDDNDDSPANHIATIMVGARVKPGRYDQRIDHYGVLRLIEDFYGLPHAGASAGAAPVVGLVRE